MIYSEIPKNNSSSLIVEAATTATTTTTDAAAEYKEVKMDNFNLDSQNSNIKNCHTSQALI